MSTRGLPAGTYRLRIDLGDGALHTFFITLAEPGHSLRASP